MRDHLVVAQSTSGKNGDVRFSEIIETQIVTYTHVNII